tara:strand:- start:69 stop:641 length:573 start_codon:yes stop_codon:yes gene_type:complete
MKFSRIFIILLFSLGSCGQSYDTSGVDVDANISTRYYSVYGTSAQEIRQQLNRNSPTKWDGYTSWYIKWNWNYKQDTNGCMLEDVNVSVDVNYTLPELETRNNLAPNLKQKWDDYYTALVQHEDGHRDFGLNAAKEIKAALTSLPAERSCNHLGNQANSTAQNVLRKYQSMEKRYDADTNHGMNDGAIFP